MPAADGSLDPTPAPAGLDIGAVDVEEYLECLVLEDTDTILDDIGIDIVIDGSVGNDGWTCLSRLEDGAPLDGSGGGGLELNGAGGSMVVVASLFVASSVGAGLLSPSPAILDPESGVQAVDLTRFPVMAVAALSARDVMDSYSFSMALSGLGFASRFRLSVGNSVDPNGSCLSLLSLLLLSSMSSILETVCLGGTGGGAPGGALSSLLPPVTSGFLLKKSNGSGFGGNAGGAPPGGGAVDLFLEEVKSKFSLLADLLLL